MNMMKKFFLCMGFLCLVLYFVVFLFSVAMAAGPYLTCPGQSFVTAYHVTVPSAGIDEVNTVAAGDDMHLDIGTWSSQNLESHRNKGLPI